MLPTLHVVEAHGKYLVPGFADMHAHPLSQKNPVGSLELMLAHGITGFRQMSGSVQMLNRLRCRHATSVRLAPTACHARSDPDPT